MLAKLVIVRGLPGSGKSTYAKSLGFTHFEADMYFMHNDEYIFDPSKLRDAHAWCQQAVKESLAKGVDTVVSNTFVKKWEVQPYLNMIANIEVITIKTHYGTIHNVPDEAIVRMKANWEEF